MNVAVDNNSERTNTMKKILLALALVGMAVSSFAQGILSTNISNGAGMHLLSTNRIRVYSIEVTTTNAYTFKFWDNDNTATSGTTPGFWSTNFINAAYVTRGTYPTSYVNTYVGYNGYTNYTTNSGIWGYTTTNAASTNALAPMFQIATSGAETRVNYVDAVFTRGVLINASGNGTITLYYRQEQ